MVSKPVLIWMRCETRANEHRAPLSPADALYLRQSGLEVTIERSPQRSFAIEDYADAVCTIVDSGSWVQAPDEAFIIGLKELPDQPVSLRHRHIFFGHAYKRQKGAEQLLARFARGGGTLLDLEYLTDAQYRRLTAFGRWAGYAGAALALLHWSGRLVIPLRPTSRDALNWVLAAQPMSPSPRVLVIGALGRCGRGACEALAAAGIEPTRWDVEETRIVDRETVLDHDIVINAILAAKKPAPFLTSPDIGRPTRRITVIADVACDAGSECNAVPIYDAPTDWQQPMRRLCDGPPPLDLLAIDNLPSLLPQESSIDFSTHLTPLLLTLGEFDAPWRRCEQIFRDVCHSLFRYQEA
jgi:saccharopine dehydrogenase (NAD+, L-lysine forming)